jgi:hypothetical protein
MVNAIMHKPKDRDRFAANEKEGGGEWNRAS